MLTNKQIKGKIQEIFHWHETIFLLPNGLPARYVDGVTGEIAHKESLLSDFGDYIPFFLYFKKNKKMSDYCKQQLELTEKEIKKGMLKRTYSGIDLVHAFEYDDLLFGLCLYWLITKERKAKKIAIFILKDLFEPKFINKSFSSFYLPQINYQLPIINSLLGGFIEIYTLFYKEFKDQKYLFQAEKLANFFLKNSFFEKYSLFPHHFLFFHKFLKLVPGLKTSQVTMMKNNTAIVWGLLELYKITKDKIIKQAILKWLKGLEACLTKENLVGQIIDFKNQRLIIQKITLTAGFAVIDLLCDIYFFIKEKEALILAEKITKAWLGHQDLRTGLLPLCPNGKKSFLDSETDMAIALFKLYELTRKKIYQKKAFQILQGIFQYHYQKNGYALEVNIKTGQIVKSLVSVKFNALLIKPLIYLLRKEEIYKDPLLFELLKDR